MACGDKAAGSGGLSGRLWRGPAACQWLTRLSALIDELLSQRDHRGKLFGGGGVGGGSKVRQSTDPIFMLRHDCPPTLPPTSPTPTNPVTHHPPRPKSPYLGSHLSFFPCMTEQEEPDVELLARRWEIPSLRRSAVAWRVHSSSSRLLLRVRGPPGST